MAAHKGRPSYKQYIKSKPTKWAMKLWDLLTLLLEAVNLWLRPAWPGVVYHISTIHPRHVHGEPANMRKHACHGWWMLISTALQLKLIIRNTWAEWIFLISRSNRRKRYTGMLFFSISQDMVSWEISRLLFIGFFWWQVECRRIHKQWGRSRWGTVYWQTVTSCEPLVQHISFESFCSTNNFPWTLPARDFWPDNLACISNTLLYKSFLFKKMH